MAASEAAPAAKEVEEERQGVGGDVLTVGIDKLKMLD